ncbi:MAG: hypothetical protein MJ070_08035 [Lachnospiraceae bacterium]|nr:hypothetical protein [Lachnospiraceae bacterium]
MKNDGRNLHRKTVSFLRPALILTAIQTVLLLCRAIAAMPGIGLTEEAELSLLMQSVCICLSLSFGFGALIEKNEKDTEARE